jgi:threonine dehydratase
VPKPKNQLNKTTVENVYVDLIDNSKVYEVAIQTPLEHMNKLSLKTGNTVYLKREDLQPVFSFKLRGAYNKIAHLSANQKARGVIAASAGNHAQGVAYSADKLGLRAIIVMPETTPEIKVKGVQELGADAVLFGESYSDAQAHAAKISRDQSLTMIHPFDDELVIAGQGTIAKEIIESDIELDYLFVCLGGGGLAAGISVYFKHHSPKTKLIGVQADGSDAMAQSINRGEIVELDDVGIFADGVAVKRVGDLTFELCRKHLDEVIHVSTDEICAAIKDGFEDTRSILEPAGALSIAGAKRYISEKGLENKRIGTIASGANMNFDRLRHVSERTEFAERREAILAVTLPEQPGSFKAFCAQLGKRSITEFNYRYASEKVARVYVGLQLTHSQELEQVINQLRDAQYECIDLTDNELAKLHIRHLVGGHANKALEERLFQFQFPEKPGALENFLAKMQSNWNISLFHYRNHGSDYGRVLCGLQIPNDEESDFNRFLEHLGYSHKEVSQDPAYLLFLA